MATITAGTIAINRGTRDGIAPGMPVVSQQGLVGRIVDVTANAARVLLVTDTNSYVSARLQTTRELGTVQGQLTGNLRMIMIPQEATVQVGDVVITSGLGGNFPPDLVIGQITSKRQFEFELNQEAEIRSLVDFDTLEFVFAATLPELRPVRGAAWSQAQNAPLDAPDSEYLQRIPADYARSPVWLIFHKPSIGVIISNDLT